MLNENIHALRKSKGLSQEELALKLNVVRQTVSKWERGLSVPDAEMLVAIGEVLDTPVSTLLGETVPASEPEGLQALSEKLEWHQSYWLTRSRVHLRPVNKVSHRFRDRFTVGTVPQWAAH